MTSLRSIEIRCQKALFLFLNMVSEDQLCGEHVQL